MHFICFAISETSSKTKFFVRVALTPFYIPTYIFGIRIDITSAEIKLTIDNTEPLVPINCIIYIYL